MHADHQIVPKLCDYFTQIVKVEAPETSDQGWLISINGQRDGHRIIDVSSGPLPRSRTLAELGIILTTVGAVQCQRGDRSMGE